MVARTFHSVLAGTKTVFQITVCTQQFDIYNDQQLRARYRFGQAGIRYIERLFGDDLRSSTDRNRNCACEDADFGGTPFYAPGHFLEVIGDTFEPEKSVMSRIVHRVSELLEQK